MGKGEINGLTKAGWSQREIANAINRDKKAVHNQQHRAKSRTQTQKLGRPPKLSERDTRCLVRKARAGNLSARDLVLVARNDFNVDIGVRRMQQILRNADYLEYSKMLKAPRLSAENKKKREIWSL